MSACTYCNIESEFHRDYVIDGAPHINICQQCAAELKLGATQKIGRVFEGGAYRDFDEDKLDFVKGLSPEVLERYMQYLGSNRLQSNGELRDWDNWKQGIPKDVYLSSLFRHVFSVWKGGGNLEDELCAVMFNAMGLLHEVLKEKENGSS